MTEPQAKDQEPTPSPYLRLPTPVLAAGLLAFLALLLAVGVYANNARGPQGIVTPTPAPASTAVPLAAPTEVPATARPTPSPAAPVVATPARPTPSATAQLVVPASPSPSPAETPLPTVEPALAAEVGQAYETFWRVKSQALLELDPTHLPEVMSDEYLSDTQNLIDQLRQENRAIKTDVSLNYTVVVAADGMASVVDYFTDNSIYVKIGTGEPLSAPVADQLSVLYRLQKTSDVWRVVQSVRSP